MPLREYRCQVCGQGEERREGWNQHPPKACPYCGALAYKRRLFAPEVVVKGGRLVNEERRFVRPRAVTNRDGSETVYESLGAARRGEYERAAAVTGSGLARTLLARKNARQLASGMLPGRESTAYRQACEEAAR
jgi:putative FmdB family regulatory protein